MTKRPALAKSELEVARIVWRLGQATVREVLEEFPKERRLDFKTVQTYLRPGPIRPRSAGRVETEPAVVPSVRFLGHSPGGSHLKTIGEYHALWKHISSAYAAMVLGCWDCCGGSGLAGASGAGRVRTEGIVSCAGRSS